MSTWNNVGRIGTGALLALALGACAAEATSESGSAELATEQASAAAIQIEQAERMLDRGGDAAKAVATLQQALLDPSLRSSERHAAVLALSRAHEAAGDREQAIGVVEQELAAHVDDDAWEQGPYTRRLRSLLTGSEEASRSYPERSAPVAAFAHVVAGYFPADSDGAVKARFFMAGGNRDVSDDLGTFNIRGALDAQQEQACPLCDRRVDVNVWTRQSDWLVIPRMQERFGSAFLVFYFDLERNRIPARYERHLPMAVAEIEALLAEGKSFAVAKERPGAPPTLLLAAPRTAMLEDVERELSQTEELPTELKHFDVQTKLRGNEIRNVVRRSWYPVFRKCYDQLLTRDATAQGKIIMHFAIAGADGAIENLKVEAQTEALEDAAFRGCMAAAAEGIHFPAAGKGRTTVSYPVQFTPN